MHCCVLIGLAKAFSDQDWRQTFIINYLKIEENYAHYTFWSSLHSGLAGRKSSSGSQLDVADTRNFDRQQPSLGSQPRFSESTRPRLATNIATKKAQIRQK